MYDVHAHLKNAKKQYIYINSLPFTVTTNVYSLFQKVGYNVAILNMLEIVKLNIFVF